MSRLAVIGFVVLYLVIATVGVYTLVAIWPQNIITTNQTNQNVITTSQTPTAQTPVKLFNFTFLLPDEVRLFWIVILSGALGTFIYSAQSLANPEFRLRKWALWFFLQPFVGSTMALIFYLVMRGGFLTGSITFNNVNAFGVGGISGLVGMFSDQASKKLQDVFTSILGTKDQQQQEGADNTKPCPQCGTDLPANSKFCNNCGAKQS